MKNISFGMYERDEIYSKERQGILNGTYVFCKTWTNDMECRK